MKKIYLLLLVTVLAFAGTQKTAYAGGSVCPNIDAWDVLNPTDAIYPFGIVTGTYSGANVLSGDLFYEGSLLYNYESTDGTIFLSDLLPGNYEFIYCNGLSQPFTITGIPCDISLLNIGTTDVSGAGCAPNGSIDFTATSSTVGATYFYNLTELTTFVEYTGQDDGSGIMSITGLPAGTYALFVSTEQDVLNSTCNYNQLVTINQPSCDMAINTPLATNVSNTGATNGSISAVITGSSCIPTAPGGNPIYVVYALLNSVNVGTLTFNPNNGRYELAGLGVGTYTLVAENGGTTCFASTNLTVALPPSTQLSNGVCGNLSYVKTSAISCVIVAGATQYEWEFSNANGVYATKLSPLNYIALHGVTPTLNWGTTWTLRVRAYVGANVGVYSAPCTIGIIADPSISGVPSTQLRPQDCGKLNYRINANNRIITLPVGGANQYEFEISQVGTGIVVATATRAFNVLFLNSVTPALSFPAQYNVRTRARIGSTWGNFGQPCLIGIIGLNRDGEEATQELAYDADGNVIVDAPYFDLTAMPNPFSDVTSLVINSSIIENVYVQFYDMTGKLVEDIKATTNERFNVGVNLSKGIYLLKARSDSGNQVTTRLVKTN
jgi:hypothetical protein